MKKLNTKLSVVFTALISCFVFAQNLPPEINATGDQNFCSGSSINIVTGIEISDPDASDITLNEVSVQISEGYAQGFDTLQLTGVHPNLTWMFMPEEGTMFIIGPATFDEFEAAILDIEFSTTQIEFTTDRSFSINLGNANYLPSTDHYYFYIDSFGISWNTARDEAASLNYFGLQGYLATITTPEEAQLAGEQASGSGWIGASDAEAEGVWKWVTGPEAGIQFWQGAVSGTPVNNQFSFWNTGEPNNFGTVEEDYAHVTDPSVGLSGSWNDLPLGGDPDVNSPYHPKGYLVEFGGLPGDPSINLSAATFLNMPQIQVDNVQGCNGEQFDLSISTNVDEVIWYDDSTLTNPINIGDTYTVILNQTTTYYVTAKFSTCTEEQLRTLTVTVDEIPEANNITIQQCDDASADGISVFELDTFSSLIANGNTTNVVTFYEDAGLTTQINALNYYNTANNQTVFAQVLNQSTDCFAVAEVTLSVAPPSTESFTLTSCDDEVEDGLTEFDLSQLNANVLIGMPVTAQTSFFSIFDDALLNNNILPNLYTTSQPYNETIFVKAIDGSECLGIYEVHLEVERLPQLAPDETVFYCLDTFPETITLNGGIVNDIPNNFYYLWSTGETTISIEVNEPGIYSVEVTEVDGCPNLRTITVLPSSLANIDTINVLDASENNQVEIITSGEGYYEYSLDFENGPYQTSNIFENVEAGIKTIYVRDKNGCGIVSETFPVIGFPKFFTPNGDANNDFWSINGFNDEFLANSRVQIFDRHGKLLAELSQNNPFWDGKYNGNTMPSDDYWFLVQLSDGRSITNHFALKR